WAARTTEQLRADLSGARFHASTDPAEAAAYERAVSATVEIVRRGTADDNGNGKTMFFTQVMAATAMRHGPVNMDAGEGKTLAFLANAILTAGAGDSLQVFTTRDVLA